MNKSHVLKLSTSLFIFILCTSFSWAQETMVYGFITDENNNPIENVHIITKKRKTVSDAQGYYEIKLLPDFRYTIEFSSVAHEPHKYKIELKDGEAVSKNITMPLKVVEIDEFIAETKSDNRHTNVTEISSKDIDRVAGGNNSVESLLSKSTVAISNNELSNQYSVRGGNFDENLVYVNGLQIYRPFLVRTGEQEGLSFLNSDMVESIKFSAGGFDAKYGDKLSSVLDIKYKEAKTFGVKANLSFQGGGLTVQNPFKINGKKLSFLGSYRYKSPTFVLNSLETQGDYNPRFHDFQTYMKYELTTRSELSFLGNYSKNRYQFQPQSRTSSFGTASDVKQVYVYFEGQEVDNYENTNLALKWDFNIDENKKISFQGSHFRTLEQEFYDIDGYYQLGIVDNNPGSPTYGEVTSITGVGEFLNHARNEFYGEVSNINHRGEIVNPGNQTKLSWGLDYQYETVDDQLREWQYIDSLGFSTNPNNNNLELYKYVSSNNAIHSSRYFGFAQYEKKVFNPDTKTSLTYNFGIRGNYWDLNDEFFITPRANISYKPNWKNRDMVFRYSAGLYNQSPFYRELRDKQGNLNKDAKSQKSFQTTLSNDYQLKLWGRPFKMTTELYYKKLWDVIPYELENLQIRYLPFDKAIAYTYGLEWRLNGELVQGNESYISFSLMQNKEDIDGDNYGYISKPTEQVFSMSIFYQDNFIGNKDLKFHLSGSYATGMPFGPPNSERGQQNIRNSSYRRVDIGFSKSLKKKGSDKKFLKHVKQAWAAVEILNLLNINNTASHLWVTDAKQTQFAVPNYLTGRMINLKLSVEF